MSTLRTDIQALRGYAVLVVVLYHAQFGPFGAGFLGVDIFFVISGFLITTLIAKGLDGGKFRLGDFYMRRAKRLMPAAYVTFLATVLAAPWFLDQQDMVDLAWQVLGAVTFTANFVFWQQTDYFAGNSDLKPLLHTWSLSVEEQYYLLLPGLLMLLPRARWLQVTLVLLALSLALGLTGAAVKPVMTFYFLPTRAWELLMGSAGALWLLRAGPQVARAAPLLRALAQPALLLLALLPAWRLPGPHPGLASLLVCTATLALILGQPASLNHGAAARLLAWWGDRSYSLYLVHWPVMALMRNAWVGPGEEVPWGLRAGSLTLSVLLAWGLHRWVEEPVRRREWHWSPRAIVQLGLVSAMLMAITPTAISLTRTEVDYRQLRRINFGLAPACDYKTPFAPLADCQTSEQPGTLLWGDSFAMHLGAGLKGDAVVGGLVQATTSGCGPFIGLAPLRRVNPETGIVYDRAWAEQCLAFNSSVVEYLRRNESVQTVVLSSVFTAYVDGAAWNHVTNADGALTERASNVGDALVALRATVAALRGMGKLVVLVAPPPTAAFNLGACWERLQTRRLALGAPENCLIDRDEYRTRRAEVLALLAGAEVQGIPVIRFDDVLCDERHCRAELGGMLLYRDAGHFSQEGAALIARHMNLPALIHEQAR
jgi:peptidoglycan/LPS O-acetylase OafA/YrhL